MTAPAEQTDSTGRKYTFAGWSNGGPATQTVTMQSIDPKQSLVLTAKYIGSGRVTITTNPAGLPIQIDGSDCRTPCTIDRAMGTQVNLGATQSVSTGDDTRLEFTGWSDGGSLSHAFSFGSSAASVTANYQTTYRVRTMADPPSAGDLAFRPLHRTASTPVGLRLRSRRRPGPGFKFRGWDGDLTSQSRLVAFPLSGPVSLRASFDKVAFVPDNGVSNAAGATPDSRSRLRLHHVHLPGRTLPRHPPPVPPRRCRRISRV